MNAARFGKHFGKSAARFMACLLVFTLILPVPMAAHAAPNQAYTNNDPANAHIMRRLNSQDRTAAIAEAAKQDAAVREAHAQSEAAAPKSSALGGGKAVRLPSSSRENVTAFRPQSMTEVLFNHGASVLGVPGLAPRRGVDGSLDEGLGFHQDGTARKAGGVAGSDPSDTGQRARTYMRSGLQNGYGMNGYGAGYGGLYEELQYDLWGRNDPTRGGRISGSGAYGGGYSRDMSDFDPMNMAMDRGLNYGAGLLNSAGEAALSGLVDGGRARLNFRLDRDGYFNGEGDVLLPFYDSARTTIYTQLGARSMHDSGDTRWISNFGLGQRWFPFAEGDDPKSGNYDAGMLMLGYNAFFDYDLTRDHQRGGIGVEAQYDWLRLASNYYFPLSDWNGSEDFDSRFVKERPAEGWDARVKAYLPFYRNVAVTGAYSQWYGDHVGMFGASRLEKDPKVWSYGLEYTPVPLVSGFVNQRSTERGRTDTEFGLNFTYHFQMPWEDQISHSKVAELRTVGGSRHEFVDRENRIILEYKAKNAYRIEYLGVAGNNVFKFRILDGFDTYRAGQTVRVSADGVTLASAPAPEKSFLARAGSAVVDFFSVPTAHAADFSQSYTTDGRGEFLVTVSSLVSGPVTLAVQAGGNTQSFAVNVTGTVVISIDTASPLPNATVGATYSQSLTASGGTGPYSFAVSSDSLPGGLSLSGSVISGTPTAAGTFQFTLTATDSTGATGNKPFSLTVGAAPVYALAQIPVVSIAVGQPTTSVGFVLTENGDAVANGTSVSLSYSTNAGAFTTTSGTATTGGGDGSFSVSLTGQTAGSVTITATFGGGKTATTTMTVGAATYTVSVLPSPSNIRVFESTTFTATIQKNGSPVPDTESVTWTVESGSGSFTDGTGASPTSRTSATSGGTATITLRATTVAAVTVKASIGGASGQGSVTVTAATYTVSLAASSTNPGESGSSVLTATVTRNGIAVVGGAVSFSWVVKGTATSQGSANGITVSGGTASTTLNGDGSRRTFTVTATSNGVSDTADVTFGAVLPSPFIAYTSGPMNWGTAQAYCTRQGGTLPNTSGYSWTGPTLPTSMYWWSSDEVGTAASVLTSNGTSLFDHGIDLDKDSNSFQVVCVP